MAAFGRTERSLAVVFILVGLMLHREARPSNDKAPEGEYTLTSPGLAPTPGEITIPQSTPLASRLMEDPKDREREDEDEEGGEGDVEDDEEDGELEAEEEEEDEVKENNEDHNRNRASTSPPSPPISDSILNTDPELKHNGEGVDVSNQFQQSLSTSSGESEFIQGGYIQAPSTKIPTQLSFINKRQSPLDEASDTQNVNEHPPYLLDETDQLSLYDPSVSGSGTIPLQQEETSSGLIPAFSSGQMDYVSSGLPPRRQVEPLVTDRKPTIHVGANPRKSPDSLAFNEVEKSSGAVPLTRTTATRAGTLSVPAHIAHTLSRDLQDSSGGHSNEEEGLLYKVEGTTSLFSTAPSSVIRRDNDVSDGGEGDDDSFIENGLITDLGIEDDDLNKFLIENDNNNDRSLPIYNIAPTSASNLQIQREVYQSAPNPTTSIHSVENKSLSPNNEGVDDVLTSDSMTLSGEPIISRQDRGAEDEEGVADGFEVDDKLNHERLNGSGYIMGDMPASPQRLLNSSRSTQGEDADETSQTDVTPSQPHLNGARRNQGHGARRRRRRTLHIGGLFELSDTMNALNGRSDLGAAQMAIQHINQQNIVNGYTLKLVPNDTKCDPGYGADAFYDLVYRKPTMMMIIGSSCSEVTKTLAEIVPYWNLVQISYAATSPALSEREKYPNFYRLAAADSSHNAARKTFIQHFGWDTVAILHQDLETFSLAVNDMHATFNKVNITVKATLTFRGVGTDLHAKMLELNRTDARIVIGSFQEDAARQVFCEAYKLGMYGPRYVWMLVGWYTEQWWTQGEPTRCTHQQLKKALEGYFSVETLNAIIGNRTSRSGLTTQQFFSEYDRLNLTKPRSAYAQVTYDTVWTVALTLRKTMEYWRRKSKDVTLEMFEYRSGARMFKDFFRTLGNLEFMGVSGPVSFEGPDRRGISVLEQNQGGEMKTIALFYPENNTLDVKCLGCVPIIWKGGKVPADKYTILTRQEHIDPGAFFTVCACGSVGILVASFFLGFNLYHRKLKYIKLSSPKLNNVAVIGCIHVYLAVILLGFDDATLDVTYFPVICTVRAFLLAAGFSLAFGAMFTKTYRVHQIFTRAHSGLVKSKLLKDTQLLFIVAALLVVDVSIIGLWVSLDPMHRSVTNFTSVPSKEDTDLLYIPQLAKCDSSHLDKWLGAFYAYKGLLLLFGVYMAWETRHVKIPVLNDSQYIGMNIYNVVLMSVTVVALSSILTDRPTLSYAVVSALIILSTTGMLGLLFLPKIYAIIKHNGSPIITSAGLTVEANTRRFAIDEKKELYYRAEVQNRVYKRELVELDISIYQLDQEISRLERLLQLPGQQLNHVGEDLMYLLPDDNEDQSTPGLMRRRKADLVRCDSSTFITDAADVCSDLPEINLTCLEDEKRKLEKKDSGFHTMSFKNSNFITAEEENPRASRLLEGDRLMVGDQSLSSPESEPFLTSRNSGAGHCPPAGSGKYASLRRQSSADGDLEEKQSLLVGDTDDEVPKDAHVESATILVNKSGIRSHSDHALGRSPRCQEHYELQDMSGGTSSGAHNQRQRTNTLPPGGAIEKQTSSSSSTTASTSSSKPFKLRRVKMSDTVTQTLPSSMPENGASDTSTASTSHPNQQQQTLSKQQMLKQKHSLSESERRRKIQALQRELARIQKELKSLGELEIEVSYV